MAFRIRPFAGGVLKNYGAVPCPSVQLEIYEEGKVCEWYGIRVFWLVDLAIIQGWEVFLGVAGPEWKKENSYLP